VVATAVAVIFVVGVVALVIALAIRTNFGSRSDPAANLVTPTHPAPAPNARPPAALRVALNL
jgi:hypothetical protein